MPSLLIRNVDATLHTRLKERAAAHGCSLEEEVRGLLRAATARQTREETWWTWHGVCSDQSTARTWTFRCAGMRHSARRQTLPILTVSGDTARYRRDFGTDPQSTGSDGDGLPPPSASPNAVHRLGVRSRNALRTCAHAGGSAAERPYLPRDGVPRHRVRRPHYGIRYCSCRALWRDSCRTRSSWQTSLRAGRHDCRDGARLRLGHRDAEWR